ncbi:hypothetical protein SmJEL517_g03917 [Synchytrium microbalum]|uniref:Uncharacterized protein n=1 Tax=Synchytrium microbalum TaxID=1806994 RepID=A0A507C4Q0_9FUNG|nr:uncharacterized protein SmJEL517_g03917 [Synchytrium microbalum]TPX33104.1 hypothetical protein SmJEL517_g03917 [Synchytrium microbalum]
MFGSMTKKSTPVDFPVFSLAFADDDSTTRCKLYVGGGGGPNKSGVKNAVVVYDVDPSELELRQAGDIQFSKQDDACMSLDVVRQEDKTFVVAGVNASQELIQAGDNKNFRLYTRTATDPDKTITQDTKTAVFELVNSVQTVTGKKAEHYQRVARSSSDGSMLVTGTTDGKLHLWKFPSLTEHRPSMTINEEIFDADFDSKSKWLVFVTPKQCQVISIEDGKVAFQISNPATSSGSPCEFRGCRFGRQDTAKYLYLIINEKSRKKSFVGQWRTDTWEMVRKRQIGKKPVTAFTMSPDGEKMAVGISDLSVVVLSANSLNVQCRVLNAHSFPVTSVAFSPDGGVLASGSADSSVHLVLLPKRSSLPSAPTMALMVILLLILFVLLYIREAQEL